MDSSTHAASTALEGPTLSQYLQQNGPFSRAEALPLIRQIAAGLQAAHDAGVIYRDFKSQNVILVPAGDAGPRAVVRDFGLARPGGADSDSTLRTTGHIAGTPTYMAPEQLEGGEITAATDIYSLGIVMYEMVTGAPPFVGDSPLSTAMKRLKEAPPPPRSRCQDLEPAWETAILRCLERDPADRFASAADVVKALSGEEVAPGRRARKRRRRRAALAALALGLVVASVAAYHLGDAGTSPHYTLHRIRGALKFSLPMVEQLYQNGRIGFETKLRIELALQEALANSLEHGNLELQSPWKEQFNQEGIDRYTLVKHERLKDPQYAERPICITAVFDEHALSISIRDSGPGFLPEECVSTQEGGDRLRCYGRGLAIIENGLDRISYRARGTEILVAARVVAVPEGVQDEAQGLVADGLHGGADPVGQGRVVVVDQEDAAEQGRRSYPREPRDDDAAPANM